MDLNSAEDCGSDLHHVTRIKCEIIGCDEVAGWMASGHLHFKYDGAEYSMDRMPLCDHHSEVVEEIVAPEARESRHNRSGRRDN